MKKFTFLFAAILLFSFGPLQAQFTVTSNHGDIEDGDVIQFGSTDMSDASLEYKVHNTSSEPINMKIKSVSFENTDGSMMELCFGVCVYSIQEGVSYPPQLFVTIQPGETQPETGDHIWSSDPGNGTETISYVFQFQQIVSDVAVNTLSFTYEYVPNLAVKANEKSFNVNIVSTLINDGQLNVKSLKPVDMQIYNLLGKQVKMAKLESGLNTVNISSLSSQIYLVRFQNTQGQTKTQKIVVE